MNRKEKIEDVVQDTDKNYAPYYDVIPKLIRERGYISGIEIGVFCGGHAQAILDNSTLELLIGIDPYQAYDPGMPRLDNQGDFDALHDFVMNRLNSNRYYHLRMTSDDALKELIDNEYEYDFIFIDGLHTYDQLKKDLNGYSKLIRQGGVIACHDYNHGSFPELTTAIDEFAKENNTKVVICPLHAVYMNKTW